MNKFLEKNLGVLKERYPELYEHLREEISLFLQNPHLKADDQFRLVPGPDGTLNLELNLPRRQFRGPLYQKNPVEEARETIQKADLKYANMVFFFGFGLGYLAKEYFKVRDRNNYAMIIIEPNARMFLWALAAQDLTELFSQNFIHFIISDKLGTVSGAFYNLYQEYTTVSRHLKILAEPRALTIESEFFTRVAAAVLSSRDMTMLSAGNSTADSMNGLENTLRNIEATFGNPGFKSLMETAKGKVALSIAAGPQLNEHWETIKSLVGKVPMIAAETLLKPMSDRGIYPDFYTALERDEYVATLVRGFYVHPRSSLFCPSLLHPEALNAFNGEVLLYGPAPEYNDYLKLDFLGRFHAGSSAGNVNLGLAVALGFETVIMVGHNLAYGHDSKVTHVSGTIDASREKPRSEKELAEESMGLRVISQDGTVELPTKIEWNLYRSQIENMIATFPHVRFINTAAKGALIEGAHLMPLSEALQTYVKEDFDYYPVKRRHLRPVSEEVRLARREETRKGIETVMARMKYWRTEQLRILAQLKKWKAKIEDKELSGKTVSIEFLNEALQQVLDLKVKAVNEDKEFYRGFISIIFAFHLAFEREVNEMLGSYTDNYKLKRDFLLRHIQYFEAWDLWLPRVIEVNQEVLDRLDQNQSINTLTRSA